MKNNKNRKCLLMTWYRTTNYGTVLQAYALSEIIEQNYQADVFMCPYTPVGKRDIASVIKKLFQIKSWRRQYRMKKDAWLLKKYGWDRMLSMRRNAICDFVKQKEKEANHGQQIAGRDLAKICGGGYDLYIAGSDQIWNPLTLNEHFLFDFVADDKPMISYASSLCTSNIPKDMENVYRKYLKRFYAVSIREEHNCSQLSEIIEKPVFAALDPTLLYGRKRWLEKMGDAFVKGGPYLFCYFLGKNREHRDFVNQLARKENLSVCQFPLMHDGYDRDDFTDGEMIWDAAPFDFISQIRSARYLVTDSFHCTAFALMMHTDFIVLEKNRKQKAQNTRIESLLKIVNLGNRMVLGDISHGKDVLHEAIDWEEVDRCLERKRKESEEWLFRALDKVLERNVTNEMQ